MARGNKANREPFVSIQAEAKEMLRYIEPAVQHMPKHERYNGYGAVLKESALGILREYHIAFRCKSRKGEHIEKMIGHFYTLADMVELCCLFSLLRDEYKLPIAMRMERIEEGINKWYNSISRQGPGQSTGEPGGTDSD